MQQVLHEALIFENGVRSVSESPNYLGLGAFETMRLRRRHQTIPGWKRHLKRGQLACETLSLKCISEDEFLSALNAAWAKSQTFFQTSLENDFLIRLIFQVERWFLSISPWSPRFNLKEGISVISVKTERPLPQIKSSSALVSVMAAKEANAKGADEALLLNSEGLVTEGAWSNFFWVNSTGDLVTAKSGMLPGITRELVLEIGREVSLVQERDECLEIILSEAQEVFITQATHGVVPVREINGKVFRVGPLTLELQRRYEEFADHHDSICGPDGAGPSILTGS